MFIKNSKIPVTHRNMGETFSVWERKGEKNDFSEDHKSKGKNSHKGIINASLSKPRMMHIEMR